ncbi:MAG: sirohydrochlorin chelatase, partial [Rhizobiaceae bacterium]|nr:sirohydrochlorin chelatase [Rhizobiaceae bacterium]
KRIYSYSDVVAGQNPDIEFIQAGYLNDHELVIDTFAQRVIEASEGAAVMNCQMCKYREQVLGFEADIGMAQESHHHHVEGIGGGLENCPCNGDCDASCREEEFCKEHGLPWTPLHTHEHSHDHEDGHTHSHHHPPYPHADHPLGPVTMKKK